MAMRHEGYRKRAEMLHKQRISLKLREVPLKPHYNGQGEAEVVPGFQLSAALRKWIVEYLDGRHIFDNQAGHRKDNQLKFYGPLQYLSEQTEINERRISGLCNGEYPFVPLSQADKLLQAIERPDMLGIEIQVVPNPNWSPERWIEHMRERGCI